MTTKELINDVAGQLNMTKKEVGTMVEALTDLVREGLLEGNTIYVNDFGTLELESKAERVVVHPKTGERMRVPAKYKLVFKPTTKLKEELKKMNV